MTELDNIGALSTKSGVDVKSMKTEFMLFDNLDEFVRAVQAEAHVTFNFASVIEVGTDFLEDTEEYLILNVKDTEADDPNNLLFLDRDKAYLYAKKFPPVERARVYQNVLAQPNARSTVLTFLVLRNVLESYKHRLDSLITDIKALDDRFDLDKYHDLSLEFERLHDRLEDFNDLLLRLQERCYPQIDTTEYISFDYRLLIAETDSLMGRYRRRFSTLRDLRQDYETNATSELNNKIAKLNDVVRKLTAITVILMIPTLIASHFGMNFASMPELRVPWAYPTVIGFQIVLMAAGVVLFRRIGWL